MTVVFQLEISGSLLRKETADARGCARSNAAATEISVLGPDRAISWDRSTVVRSGRTHKVQIRSKQACQMGVFSIRQLRADRLNDEWV